MAKKKAAWKKVTTVHSFMDSKLVRVFGIKRVSGDDQAQNGESLGQQEEVITNWVRSKSSLHAPQKWKLIEIFTENENPDGQKRGRTATKREGRAGLAKALGLAKLGMIDVVIVTKLDRLARNLKDYIDVSAEFNENGVALVCLDLDVDGSTPDGQMILRNHANLAQWQAERIAQYSIETVQRHLNQGRPIGPPSIGYRICKGANDKSTFEPDPAFQEHIEFIDQSYLRLKSVGKVVDLLHQKGYKTPDGKTYSKPQVSRILQNIRYTARQEHGGKIYDGKWPPLRTRETHDAIQAIFAQNRVTHHSPNSSNRNYIYLAKGLLRCGHCGSAMVARPGTGRGGRYYGYYACQRSAKTRGIDCQATSNLAAGAVDNAIIAVLQNLRLAPDNVANIIKEANRATASTLGVMEADLERVQSRLKEARTRIANLVEVLTDKGMAELVQIKQKLEALNHDEAVLVAEEFRLKNEILAEQAQATTAQDSIQALQLFEDFFARNQSNRERIQAVLPRLVNSVVCTVTDKKKGIGKLKIGLFGRPFDKGENAELWNQTLQKVANEFYNDKIGEVLDGKFDQKPSQVEPVGNSTPVLTNSGKLPYNAIRLAGDKHCDPILDKKPL